jgi:hypothetical protein
LEIFAVVLDTACSFHRIILGSETYIDQERILHESASIKNAENAHTHTHTHTHEPMRERSEPLGPLGMTQPSLNDILVAGPGRPACRGLGDQRLNLSSSDGRPCFRESESAGGLEHSAGCPKGATRGVNRAHERSLVWPDESWR